MTQAVRTFLDGRVTLRCGDCLDVLAGMEENSVDSVVCDPPYHLTSIVKRFGGDMPPRTEVTVGRNAYGRHEAGFMGKQWDGGDIAFQPDTWRKVLRVLKPGGYILAFASTRGFGRMSVAIEDAGFITHPFIAWIFGSGFPKATRIKADGYDGFRYGGQALKPAIEPIYMGQKPFSEASGTSNILRWGTGALNIDGCRVGTEGGTEAINFRGRWAEDIGARNEIAQIDKGRWPANVIHDGSDEVLAAFPETESGYSDGTKAGVQQAVFGKYGAGKFAETYGDSGNAARFFYTAKADAEDRLGSKHPTVKPLDLMQYLVRLVTPPSGFYCEKCGRKGHGNRAEKASKTEAVRAVRHDVSPNGQSGKAAVLLEGVCGQRDAPEASALRRMPDAVPPDGGAAEVLRSDMLPALDREEQEDQQGICGDEEGLSAVAHAESPASETRLHSRASVCGGAEDRSPPASVGSCSPHQRDQDGQSVGEPATDAEARPRQTEPAASEPDHMSLLRDGDDDEPSCPHCGGKVSFRHSVVLDPFAGTGTTGEAAWREGMRAVLIEREPEYQADIARRMELAEKPTKRAAVAKSKNNLQGAEGTPLFTESAA